MAYNQIEKEDKGSQPESMDTTTSPTTLKRKHSELGIASFIISIVSILIFLSLILAYFGPINPYTTITPHWISLMYKILSYSTWPLPFAPLLALGLGIGGLIQKDRKKIFAIFGTIFSAVVIVCSCLLLFMLASTI
jgi:hypothetical protein